MRHSERMKVSRVRSDPFSGDWYSILKEFGRSSVTPPDVNLVFASPLPQRFIAFAGRVHPRNSGLVLGESVAWGCYMLGIESRLITFGLYSRRYSSH